MKKYLKLLFFGLVVFTITLSILLINQKNNNVIKATDVENPAIAVHKKNIAYSGEIHIVYAISYEGFNPESYPVKMLFYNEVQDEYTKDNASYEITTAGKLVIADKSCVVFESKGLAAKQMTEDIYGRAYVEINGETIYTDVVKYSVLEYSYETLGKVDAKITKLLEAMKYYGSLAQLNFGYLLDRLANEVYFNVNVIGGTLEDGFTQGRYVNRDIITITANDPDDGYKFLYWQDESKNIVSVDKVINVEVSRSFTYEAVFVELQTVKLTEKLVKEVQYNTPAEASNLPDYVTVSNKDGILEQVKVNWDTTTFDPEYIGEQTIYGELVDTDYILDDTLSITINVSAYTFEYNESKNEYAISKYYGLSVEETIPSTFNGIPVTTIKQFAFEDALALKNLIINSNITLIEQEAISYCDNLEKITVPFVGESISSNTYFGYIFGATSYSENNTYVPRSIKEVTIKDGTTSISSNAFDGCAYIKTIKIPSGVKTINSYAFSGCTNLTDINLSKDLTKVYSYVFSGCSKLTNVYYENTIEDWCNISFSSSSSNPMCSATNFYMKNELGEYEEVTSITLPETLTTIKQYQFYGFDNLESIIVPNTITTINSDVFYDCKNLSSVYYTGTIEEWSNITFSNEYSTPMCYGASFYMLNENDEYEHLTDVVLPKTVRIINDYQFYGFESVSSFTLTSRVRSIGNNAFCNCASVEEVYFDGTLTAWTNILFESLQSNPMYKGSKLFTKDTGVYEEINNLPSDIEIIAAYTFAGCESLVEIDIPTTLTTISNYAFDNCNNLKNINYNGTFEEWDLISIGSYNDGIHNAKVYCLKQELNGYVYNRDKCVELGKYPQTVETDTNIISNLDNITTTNSLGYIEYNGAEYKKVTANPYSSNYTFMDGSKIVKGNTYYFKVETIIWRVIELNDDTYKLISYMILDNTQFYSTTSTRIINDVTIYSNNYEYSNIRAWLNGYDGTSYNVDDYTNKGFIDIAFTEEERKLINTTLVDNSLSSTFDTTNDYVCNNTTDNMYLLSEYENLYLLGSAIFRQVAVVSDYARSNYCYMNTDSTDFGRGDCWLRSPYYKSDYACIASLEGFYNGGKATIYSFANGVRPAFEITI